MASGLLGGGFADKVELPKGFVAFSGGKLAVMEFAGGGGGAAAGFGFVAAAAGVASGAFVDAGMLAEEAPFF
jgi:hypothetical protein